MADYQKLSVRFSNQGMNTAHDPGSLPFGKFTWLQNIATQIEGQLTARYGMDRISSEAISGGTYIHGMRKLNDSVREYATYVVRTNTGLDCTINTTDGKAIAVEPFGFASQHGGFLATGFSSLFGSIVIDRTSRSNQVWAYIGDLLKMVKIAINSGQTIDVNNVGITRPTGPPTLAQGTDGSLTQLGTYYYRYTLYNNNTGVESLFNSSPDPLTTTPTSITLSGSNDHVDVTIPTESVDSQVTHARIYRKGGSLVTWNLIASTAYTGTTTAYKDQFSDLAIAAGSELDEVSDKPFTTTNSSGVDVAGTPLPYLFGPISGYLLGCGDPENTGYAYWSNKFNPDAQNPANRVEVTSPQDPLMAGLVFDGKALVFSKEGLYELILGLGNSIDGTGSTWTPFKTSCGHGLMAPHAYVAGPEIYFLAKDGVYATSGGTERSLTTAELKPLFQGGTTVSFSPISYAAEDLKFHIMAIHENELWFQYRAQDTNLYVLVYNLLYKRWHLNAYRVALGFLYDDEETSSRLIIGDGNGYISLKSGTTDEGGSPATIPTIIKTGFITLGDPLVHKEWGALIMDLNPQGASVTVTVYSTKGTTSIATATWTDATRSRKILSLGDTFAEDIKLEISWATSGTAPILYGYEILYRPDVIQLARWSVTGINHGLEGWQIVRSAYITLRSDGLVNFAVTADGGSTNTYSIASTAGAKLKIFIPFNPIKGKLFTYVLTINTATYFRLYVDDCEVHVKPWISSLGYKGVNPFHSAGNSGQVEEQSISGNDQGVGGGGGGSRGQGGGGNPFGADAFGFLGGGGVPMTPADAAVGIIGSPDASDAWGGPGSGTLDPSAADLT